MSHQKACNLWFSLLVDQDLVPFSCFNNSPPICKNQPGVGPPRVPLGQQPQTGVRSVERRGHTLCYTGALRVLAESVSGSSASTFVLVPRAAGPEMPWQRVLLSQAPLPSGSVPFHKRKTLSRRVSSSPGSTVCRRGQRGPGRPALAQDADR